jgi:hypothetical protein
VLLAHKSHLKLIGEVRGHGKSNTRA